MIISSYVQGFSQTVSIKKTQKTIYCICPGCTQLHVCGFRKKNPELNRYKI